MKILVTAGADWEMAIINPLPSEILFVFKRNQEITTILDGVKESYSITENEELKKKETDKTILANIPKINFATINPPALETPIVQT